MTKPARTNITSRESVVIHDYDGDPVPVRIRFTLFQMKWPDRRPYLVVHVDSLTSKGESFAGLTSGSFDVDPGNPQTGNAWKNALHLVMRELKEQQYVMTAEEQERVRGWLENAVNRLGE